MSFISRVEGEGKIFINFRDGYVENVEVLISEAPRFFEYIVKGKRIEYVPDLVSRVCGFCGSSYVLVAVKAFEKCLGIDVPEDIDKLREMIHLAERVKSHAIHIFLLNLPDFLETPNTFELKAVNPQMLRDVMKFISYAGTVMEMLGGRLHNVVNIRIGGVYWVPEKDDVAKILKILNEAVKIFKPLANFVLSLKNIPCENLSKPCLTLSNGEGYPHISDEVVFYSNSVEEKIGIDDFENVIQPEQRKGKNALVYRYRGLSYVVGPIARFNKAFHKLHGEVQDMLKESGCAPPLKDVRQQIVARIAETYDALLTIQKFFEQYRKPSITGIERLPNINVEKVRCVAAIEAPRGILYHRYDVDKQLKVIECNMVTPTAQNIASMEELSLQLLKKELLGEKIDEKVARKTVEKLVRAFDPCISCSVHITMLKH